MKYTKQFSLVIRTQGAPHLTKDQLQRIMNIIVAETRINTLEGLNMNSHHIFSRINHCQNTIKRLSKDLEPQQLIEEMLKLSQNN